MSDLPVEVRDRAAKAAHDRWCDPAPVEWTDIVDVVLAVADEHRPEIPKSIRELLADVDAHLGTELVWLSSSAEETHARELRWRISEVLGER